MREGVTLSYMGARMGTGSGGQETWNATLKVLVLNQSTLVFESSSSGANASLSSNVTVKYQDGFPKYVDYLTALIYLPPECLTASVHGNLQWATQIKTKLDTSTVVNVTWQISNFSVEAGAFESVNVTLSLVGLDYGVLTFIYDTNSGILVYEQWVPDYGDIVILSLTEATYRLEQQPILLNLILLSATIVTPTAIAIKEIRGTLKKRDRRRKQQPTEAAKLNPIKKPIYVILAGALLDLASIFLPWTMLGTWQVYLPLSLPSALTTSPSNFELTSGFFVLSAIVHGAAVTAWLDVAAYLYLKKNLVTQLMAIASAVLTLCSVLLFIQSGWVLSWGLPIAVTGSVFMSAGIATARIRTGTLRAEKPDDRSYRYASVSLDLISDTSERRLYKLE
jgi:hypothetical protein